MRVELNGNILGEEDLDTLRSAIDANAGASSGEAVMGETDEMEDPDEDEDEKGGGDDEENGSGGEENGDEDDDDEDDDEGSGGDMNADEEDALVADVMAKFNV